MARATQRVRGVDSLLNPEALTIGFARRFATYKRATLLFRDDERIRRILSDPERPVQIVFAGKAHPDDEPGKALIRRIYELSKEPGLEGKIIFVEDYDMNLARDLISGADLWLNTPRRPREASGTSGQKAALCGAPNFSVLDGWWVEGFNGENGWEIGEDRSFKDEATQDDADADSLYHTLEEEIIPLFFDRDARGVPTGWVRVMKNSIETCAPAFSMQRMLIDYVEDYYMPAAASGQVFVADGYAAARGLAAWKATIAACWHEVQIRAERVDGRSVHVADALDLSASVRLPEGMTAKDVTVEAIFGRAAHDGQVELEVVSPLTRTKTADGAVHFTGSIVPEVSGSLTVGMRVRPYNEVMVNPFETGRMCWA